MGGIFSGLAGMYKWLGFGVGPSRFAFCAMAFGILSLLTVRTVLSEVIPRYSQFEREIGFDAWQL
jgi:hypothetical protein